MAVSPQSTTLHLHFDVHFTQCLQHLFTSMLAPRVTGLARDVLPSSTFTILPEHVDTTSCRASLFCHDLHPNPSYAHLLVIISIAHAPLKHRVTSWISKRINCLSYSFNSQHRSALHRSARLAWLDRPPSLLEPHYPYGRRCKSSVILDAQLPLNIIGS